MPESHSRAPLASIAAAVGEDSQTAGAQPSKAPDERIYLTATELTRRYRTGTLSPVEVVTALLDRIEGVNPKVNALYFIDAEGALRAAAASEDRWRRGEPQGVLDGVPVMLKDSVSAVGMPSYYGTLATNPAQAIAAEDAPVTARLKEAGAVLIGKTTMPDFGMIASGISSRYGVTRNPWDLSRNSGGSSSGAGAGLAAGFAPLAIGTDIGGSVRIPAAFCGAFALKPSYGRVPLHYPAPWLIAGPMTRTVVDAALLMNVITRPDDRDFTALPHIDRDYCAGIEAGIRGVRIGVLGNIGFGLAVDPQVTAMLGRAAEIFASLGAIVEPVLPIFDKDPEPDFDRCVHVGSYLTFAGLSLERQQSVMPIIADWCRRRNADSVVELMRSQIAIGKIRQQTLMPFAHCDYLLSPTMAVLPYAAELPWPPGGTAHNPFCFPFNVSEQPAASVNGGFSCEGLPIGLQIIGRRFDDHGVLRVAFAFEQAAGYYRRHP